MAADLTYDKKARTLTGLGGTWNAVSGGTTGGYAPISNGTYSAPPYSLMTDTQTNQRQGVPSDPKYDYSAYADRRGFHWFFHLGQGNLGIHPDGNVPGTPGGHPILIPSRVRSEK